MRVFVEPAARHWMRDADEVRRWRLDGVRALGSDPGAVVGLDWSFDSHSDFELVPGGRELCRAHVDTSVHATRISFLHVQHGITQGRAVARRCWVLTLRSEYLRPNGRGFQHGSDLRVR